MIKIIIRDIIEELGEGLLKENLFPDLNDIDEDINNDTTMNTNLGVVNIIMDYKHSIELGEIIENNIHNCHMLKDIVKEGGVVNIIMDFKQSIEWSEIIENNNNDWRKISTTRGLSESFIREFQDKVEWHFICENQILSESFIREFQDKVDWYPVSFKQVLSEDFKIEFKDKVLLYELWHVGYYW